MFARILIVVLIFASPLAAQSGNEWIRTNTDVGIAKQVRVHLGGVSAFDTALFQSTDRGETWTRLTLPGPFKDVQYLSDGTALAPGRNTLCSSSTAGTSWETSNVSAKHWNGMYYLLDISDIVVQPSDSILVSGFYLIPSGASWELYSAVMMGRLNEGSWRTSDVDRLLSSTDSVGALYFTKGGETRWQGGSAPQDRNIIRFAASENDFGIALTRNGAFYRMTKGRALIDSLSFVLSDPTDLAITPQGIIYASSSTSGIWRSDDKGESWVALNDGRSTWRITDIDLRPGEPVYLATDDGVYRSSELVPNGGSSVRSDPHINIPYDIYRTDGNALRIHSSHPGSFNVQCYDMLGRSIFQAVGSDNIIISEVAGVSPVAIVLSNSEGKSYRTLVR